MQDSILGLLLFAIFADDVTSVLLSLLPDTRIVLYAVSSLPTISQAIYRMQRTNMILGFTREEACIQVYFSCYRTSPTHNPKYWHMTRPARYIQLPLQKKGGKTSGGLPSCSGHAQNLHDADRHLWSFAVQLQFFLPRLHVTSIPENLNTTSDGCPKAFWSVDDGYSRATDPYPSCCLLQRLYCCL